MTYEGCEPLLQWPGGKRKIAARVADAFGGKCRGVYREPFLGSGAVYLYMRAHGLCGPAFLSDANPRLVNFHAMVRDHPEDVNAAARELPDRDFRDAYYEVRYAFNAGPAIGAAQAARMLWLNRACFNGLYRENKRGEFNVPVGSKDRISLPSLAHILRVSDLLQDAAINFCDFRGQLAWAEPGDSIYCDPPYIPASDTAAFTSYSRGGFTMDDQHALAGLASSAAKRGVHVVISNHDTEYARSELYPEAMGFEVVDSFGVQRNIGGNAASRKKAPELLVRAGPPATGPAPYR